MRGRLWRKADPSLPEDVRAALVKQLMDARRMLRGAQPEAVRAAARRQVDAAKRALGERGPVWWDDGAPDRNRQLAKNTQYRDWFAGLAIPTPENERKAPMQLEGSCHCRKVKFSVDAGEPVPFMRCYCSICRKTAGGGGYAINLGAKTHSMKVTGKRWLGIYRARLEGEDGEGPHTSEARRYFCAKCGSALWVWDPRWPELVHPHASAIDTPLPVPPENVHIMLGSKAPWVAVEGQAKDPHFDKYPDLSLAQWHEQKGLPREP